MCIFAPAHAFAADSTHEWHLKIFFTSMRFPYSQQRPPRDENAHERHSLWCLGCAHSMVADAVGGNFSPRCAYLYVLVKAVSSTDSRAMPSEKCSDSAPHTYLTICDMAYCGSEVCLSLVHENTSATPPSAARILTHETCILMAEIPLFHARPPIVETNCVAPIAFMKSFVSAAG